MSNFGKMSDTIINLGKNDGIKCRIINNASCVKCDAVEREMVRVGAFIMCEACHKTEFNVDVIPVDSTLYTETYSKFLDIYQNK